MNPLFSGMGGLDPSKMNPQTIGAISELMQTLNPEQMMKMQSIMHNSMAGFDVKQEMLQFESTLPPSFKEKMAKIMYMAQGIDVKQSSPSNDILPATQDEARLVILRSVAGGFISPEEALKVLFT